MVFNANGTFGKVQKSKLVRKTIPCTCRSKGICSNRWHGNNLANVYSYPRRLRKSWCYGFTWEDFVTTIISLIISRHQLATKIIMVNDLYNLLHFIKDAEKDRWKQGNSTIPRVFPKLRDKFLSVSEFKMFLCSDENKTRLQHLIKNELFRAVSSILKDLIYSCGKFRWNVSKNEEIIHFKCE